MATLEVLQMVEEGLLSSPPKAENEKPRDLSIEKKIDFLESLTGKVSNRRSRRWLNDRLLMELVPRLDAEEIRGLFAPPPWGDDVPLSPFCMTNMGEWDKFRNIDMDKQACIRVFIQDGGDEVLSLRVQDPFHRLLLHGVCEFYNLASVTETESKDAESFKTTKIKKKMAVVELPNITVSNFLRMSKEGVR
ncbi:PREDICTED: uncharacterized protein LOC105115243 isoform X2 [Populus euphratica]|uniref:Uncharacterized protein LOC105115243 isoform X2 n=1 Tax=Populus euphratica TaxID=75702 RepID=A0AAJ6TFI4_POPEU|nr:PREDICTED: uncharacterized protein LOC105115243 isoform X2 [Populus euphratica]